MKTKTTIVAVILFIVCFTHSYSQAPTKQWDADFGGDNVEELFAVQQTTDGGYIAGGYSDSGPTGTDYWIVKTDANGVEEWDKRYGGNSVDQCTALEQTTDGGYILGGISFSGISGDKTQASRGKNDYWIVKIDANGVKQWDATFGGKGFEELRSLQQTSDGGYILGGFSKSGISGDQTQESDGGKDFWIVKTDANGVKQWDARFGGNKFEELYSVRQTGDGGYILGGYSLSDISGDKTQNSQGGYDYWIVKTDDNGEKQWDATFGGIDDDWLTAIQQTNDGYIIGGWSWSGASGDKSQPTKGDNDYWIIKTDDHGVKQWDADFGGSSNDYLNPIQQTIDGGYILGGYSSSPISGDKTQASIGGTDYWMVKTDANGTKQWDAQFGGSDFDFLFALQQTDDGGYILGGYSSSNISGDKTQNSQGYSDYWIVKTDAGGTVICNIPTNLITVGVASDQAKLKWDTIGGAIAYKVAYKIAGSSEWTIINSTNNHKELHGLVPGTEYLWKVKSLCSNQPFVSSDWAEKQSFTTDPLRMEAAFETMFEVNPNPVASVASITFILDQPSNVLIRLFSVVGKEIMTVTDENFSEGNHELNFHHQSLAAGIYFLQLKTDNGMVTKKVVVN